MTEAAALVGSEHGGMRTARRAGIHGRPLCRAHTRRWARQCSVLRTNCWLGSQRTSARVFVSVCMCVWTVCAPMHNGRLGKDDAALRSNPLGRDHGNVQRLAAPGRQQQQPHPEDPRDDSLSVCVLLDACVAKAARRTRVCLAGVKAVFAAFAW
jgi:hypothetical protein